MVGHCRDTMVAAGGRVKGALTFRLPVETTGSVSAMLGLLDEYVGEVRAVVARSGGVGSYVAPRDQVPCRFVVEDGTVVMEIRVQVETSGDHRALLAEIRRRRNVEAVFRSASLQVPK